MAFAFRGDALLLVGAGRRHGSPWLRQILEPQVDLAGDILLHTRRDAHPARRRQAFEASGDVDTVAKDVAVFDNDVALMDADTVFRNRHRVALSYLRLHFAGATQRIDSAAEFDHQTVAGGLVLGSSPRMRP